MDRPINSIQVKQFPHLHLWICCINRPPCLLHILPGASQTNRVLPKHPRALSLFKIEASGYEAASLTTVDIVYKPPLSLCKQLRRDLSYLFGLSTADIVYNMPYKRLRRDLSCLFGLTKAGNVYNMPCKRLRRDLSCLFGLTKADIVYNMPCQRLYGEISRVCLVWQETINMFIIYNMPCQRLTARSLVFGLTFALQTTFAGSAMIN